MKEYDTNLSSEYYVLSLLYRQNFDAYITLGNKKAIDIIIKNFNNEIITIDVKGLRGKTSFPVDNITPDKINETHFIIFISFLGKILNFNTIPELYVVPSKNIEALTYSNPKKNRRVVQLSKLRKNKSLYYYNTELLHGYIKTFQPPDESIDIQTWYTYIKVYNGIRSKMYLLADYEEDGIINIDLFIKLYSQYSKSPDFESWDILRNYFIYKTIPHIIAFQERMVNILDDQTNLFIKSLINDRIKRGEEYIHPSELTLKLGEDNLKNKLFIDNWSEKNRLEKIERKKRLEK